MAPHSSTPAWRIPWREEPGGLQSHGVAESRTRLRDFTGRPYNFKGSQEILRWQAQKQGASEDYQNEADER